METFEDLSKRRDKYILLSKKHSSFYLIDSGKSEEAILEEIKKVIL
jgi:thymidylate kinase